MKTRPFNIIALFKAAQMKNVTFLLFLLETEIVGTS